MIGIEGVTVSDLNVYTKEDMELVLSRYHEYVQKGQISEILKDRCDEWLASQDLDENSLEGIIDKDDLTLELWDKLQRLLKRQQRTINNFIWRIKDEI